VDFDNPERSAIFARDPQGQTVGYVRVSSADQNLARQLEVIAQLADGDGKGNEGDVLTT